jgi:hypothetical protein
MKRRKTRQTTAALNVEVMLPPMLIRVCAFEQFHFKLWETPPHLRQHSAARFLRNRTQSPAHRASTWTSHFVFVDEALTVNTNALDNHQFMSLVLPVRLDNQRGPSQWLIPWLPDPVFGL